MVELIYLLIFIVPFCLKKDIQNSFQKELELFKITNQHEIVITTITVK